MLKVLKLILPLSSLLFFIFLILVIVNRDLGIIAFPILIGVEVYLISKDWGTYLILLRRFDQAIDYFTRKINSNNPTVHDYNGRGASHFFKGDYQAAIRDLKKAVQIDPKFIGPYENLGNVYAQTGDLEIALANFEKALAINPRSASSYSGRGTVFMRQQKLEEALADFNQAIRLNPNDAISYYQCGSIFFESQDYKTALRCYKDARKLDSNLLESRAGIAIALYAMGKTQQAKNTWKSVVRQMASYQNPEWLKKELKWAEPLIEEARKLIATSNS